MIDKLFYIFLFFILNILTSLNTYGGEVFNFDVTEVEIINEGNIFIGKKSGTATTEDGTIIKAKNFRYDKITNILVAIGDVEIDDKKENIIIYSNKITYFKNKEFILTEGKSKAINHDAVIDANNFSYDKITNILKASGNVKIDNKDENYLIFTNDATYLKNKELFLTEGQSKAINEGMIINADNFEYNKINNIMNANGKVEVKDTINDYLILANDATYYKNFEKIVTKGNTDAFIQSRYTVNSKDVTYLHNEKTLTSQHKTKILDKDSQVYFLEKFNYLINQEIVKGEEALIITNYNLPKSDKIFLENAIINLKDKKFIAKDTKIKIHKDIFEISENDPRIEGVSSRGNRDLTIINKGVFTSCKKNDNCPPWSVSAPRITHDKIEKTMIYDHAVLKIYDFPVLYLPKFFHPDPSVKRRSGFIQPEINESTVLGSSWTLPYFKVISENKDLTLTPTWFDTDTLMSAVEYRQENKHSSLLGDFAFVNNYQSYTTKKTNSLSHYFINFSKDLNLENFNSSSLNTSIKKVSNDSYLSVFEQYLTKDPIKPVNFNNLTNSIILDLNHEDFNFESGIQAFENLQVKKRSDRYQYALPYYNFNKLIDQDYFEGNISFGSGGSNVLSNTNKLETKIVNNFSYNSLDFISNLGFKNNFGANFKNLNSVGKKSSKYKSSMRSEIVSIYNLDSSLPLIKESEKSKNLLTPKLSFRFNPSDMRNSSKSGRTVDPSNVWSINRLSLGDSFESGRSLTLGIDYKHERLRPDNDIKKEVNLKKINEDKDENDSVKNITEIFENDLTIINDNENEDDLEQINNYFEIKLATVLRDKEEKFIPISSTINRTTSNLFGSVSNKFSDNIKVGYNFSLDNDFNTLEYNNFYTDLTYNNIITNFNFVESNGERGDTNFFTTSIEYNFNDENFLKFKTRRNRKINLTEFYDLVYEYKNDCLTAGIKYKKTYYTDGDLRPTQNLLFTITLFPITEYEHDGNDLLENEDSFLNNLELDSRAIKSK